MNPSSASPTPLPYTGHRLDRLQNLGRSWSQDKQDTDSTGKVAYHFNSLGFRGPEFVPQAEFIVFVFGESDAFGIGVEREQSWAYLVAESEARRRGIDPAGLCLMSFAEGGASNASIARQVLSQCSAVRPDLVLINFACNQRTEGYAQNHAFPVGTWHVESSMDRTVQQAPTENGLRERLRDQVRRARAFLAFCDEDQGLYQSLRDILLVQETLGREGLQALAIVRQPEHFYRSEIVNCRVLGPLVARLDRRFFALHISPAQLKRKTDWNPDGLHFGTKTHQAIAKSICQHLQTTTLPKVTSDDHRTQAREQVEDTVRDFYRELPFNYHGTPEAQVKAIQHPSIETTYPDLHQHLERQDAARVRILEVGCGAGWLTHSLGLHYGVHVDAIDITTPALQRARSLGPLLGTEDLVEFRECSIFDFAAPQRYDLAVSIGVLHHTGDALGALERIVRHLTPGGHVYLGLYHAPGRRVFLEEMWRIAETEGEEAAYQRYRELHSVQARDETLARSWFRDQVLHPHETQHTLREVCSWFDSLGLTLASTSINGFAPVKNREKLFKKELAYEKVSRKALFEENRYFPGFFTVFGRRTS